MVRLTACKGILENLLEAQELEDAKVDSRVETETSLVRTESRVVLNAEATVDLNLALVVLPDNTELDDTLGNGGDLKCAPVLGVLLEQRAVLEGRGKLWDITVSLGSSCRLDMAISRRRSIDMNSVARLTLECLLKLRLGWKVGHDY